MEQPEVTKLGRGGAHSRPHRQDPAGLSTRRISCPAKGEVSVKKLVVVVAVCLFGVTTLAGAAVLSSPVQVTDDQFAANEESLGMDQSGQLLMGMWNDWHSNDGCGISYSTNAGASWAPESFAPGFTFFTNDPS